MLSFEVPFSPSAVTVSSQLTFFCRNEPTGVAYFHCPSLLGQPMGQKVT
jgi:hypothetical protein